MPAFGDEFAKSATTFIYEYVLVAGYVPFEYSFLFSFHAALTVTALAHFNNNNKLTQVE